MMKLISIADRPDAVVRGSSLGDVSWQTWCEADRLRQQAKGERAIIHRDKLTGLICVAVIRSAKGGRP